MALEECPHCITRVFFNDNGICPACGQKKYILPGKNREEILKEQEKMEVEEKINYHKKNGPRLLIGGIVVTLVASGISVWTLFFGNWIIWWTGGIFLGLGIIAKGYAEIRQAKELKYFYELKNKKN